MDAVTAGKFGGPICAMYSVRLKMTAGLSEGWVWQPAVTVAFSAASVISEQECGQDDSRSEGYWD